MSKLITRYLEPYIEEDLTKKMVFLGGPRQVGKTTLAQGLIRNYHDGHPAYLNWDSELDRHKIKNRDWPKIEPLVVLDEIHKFKNWRNLVKGFYDTLKNTHSFLVTGSARLDHFRKGGDSLLGRYHYYRLHPYSLPELNYAKGSLEKLIKFGGFPESYGAADERQLRRWHIQRLNRLIRTDLNGWEDVKDLDKIFALAEELPNRVGSPLSINSLANDIEADFKTIKRWLGILSSLYYSFQIAPFGSAKIRAVKKEQKLYMWDWSQIESHGIRFENMVASHLLKYCHFMEDVEGYKMELRFIRDTDKREIDFVVLKNKKPIFAVECKHGDKSVSPHIFYYRDRTAIPRFYQVHLGSAHRQVDDQISVMPFATFCKEVGLK
ncbi:MAG: ATP-binding protein [Bdellovibrionales bacterium]|nr:ATP-binding protein [Bdellovibrionales bacterium]